MPLSKVQKEALASYGANYAKGLTPAEATERRRDVRFGGLNHGEWMRSPLTNAGCEDPQAPEESRRTRVEHCVKGASETRPKWALS